MVSLYYLMETIPEKSKEETGDYIALTISPLDRTNKYITLKDIYFSDLCYIENQLHYCSKDFIIYPELDLTGRLHYHGYLTIKDKIKWIKSFPKLKKLGYICIKKADNLQGWKAYCSKEWEITKKILNIELPIQWLPRQHKKDLVNTENKVYGVEYLLSYEQ